MSFKSVNVRLGIKVTRYASKRTPFKYEMFYCKQNDNKTAELAYESVGLLGVLGGIPGEHKMELGESRKYWCHCTLVYTTDYYGESDEDVEFISVKRVK